MDRYVTKAKVKSCVSARDITLVSRRVVVDKKSFYSINCIIIIVFMYLATMGVYSPWNCVHWIKWSRVRFLG